jgi:hypothetical protein
VVPLPAKKSSTVSPGFDDAVTIRRMIPAVFAWDNPFFLAIGGHDRVPPGIGWQLPFAAFSGPTGQVPCRDALDLVIMERVMPRVLGVPGMLSCLGGHFCRVRAP